MHPIVEQVTGLVNMAPGFVQAFLKSWGMILVSEVGDKTFFIAAVMAMRNPRMTVFLGAMAALATMTVLSAFLGWAAPNLMPRKYTHWIATVLFFFFGAKMLYDVAMGNVESAEEELEEVEHDVLLQKSKSEQDVRKQQHPTWQRLLRAILSPVFLKAFTFTFLAEWGDRSQIATIVLAASADVYGVTLGGILGHFICTGGAVLGGKHLAQHINERTVAICGGILFLLFAAHSTYEGIQNPELQLLSQESVGWGNETAKLVNQQS